MPGRKTKATPADSQELLEKARKAKGQKKAIYEVGAALVAQLSELNARQGRKPARKVTNKSGGRPRSAARGSSRTGA